MRWASTGLKSEAVLLVLLVLVVALAWRPITRAGALTAALGWPLANLVTDVCKATWPSPRPGNVLPDAIVRIGMSPSMGTASAHSANMMFIATVFLFYYRAWGIPWLAFALLVGYSRVFLAAHYPSQVLLGWAVGVFTGWMVCQTVQAALRVWGPRSTDRSADPPASDDSPATAR